MTQRVSDERLARLLDGCSDPQGVLADLRDCRAENKRLREAALVLKQAYDADAIAEWFMDTDEDGVDVKAVWCAALAASSGAGENDAATAPRGVAVEGPHDHSVRSAQAATPAPSDAALVAAWRPIVAAAMEYDGEMDHFTPQPVDGRGRAFQALRQSIDALPREARP